MQNETTGNVFFQILKGAAISLAISLFGVIILASVLLYVCATDSVIYIVNQCIKVVALAAGVLLFVRGEKGFLQGMAIAALFTALSYLAFSAIGGNFALSWLIFAELALALLVGGLCGGIAVNLRER